MHSAIRRSRMELPLTSTSASRGRAKISYRTPRKRLSTDVVQLVQLLLAIVGLGLTVVALQHTWVGSTRSSIELDADEDDEPSLAQTFPSLHYALRNNQLVLLYFAASWCPMSTPVTHLIDETLGDLLLPQSDAELPQRRGLSLVYVSSDRDEDELQDYLMRNWLYVPFATDERARIKRHFSTCAKRELHALHMERKHEIPTLIVIEGASEKVLTFDGVKDLKREGAHAVDRWMDLAQLSDALSRKQQ